MRVGSDTIQAELADDAKIGIDISDYRFARPGDSVQVEGWYYKGRPAQVYANQLTIVAATPLGVTEKQK